MFTEPGTAREEAERLVAAVLAAATLAANANPQISTGSAECCVCPLCKVIAAVRDPDPQTVERLATGAGDLAAGVASFLRHLGNAAAGAKDAWATASDPHDDTSSRDTPSRDTPSRDTPSRGNGRLNGADQAKGTATRASSTGWPAATSASSGTAADSASAPGDAGPDQKSGASAGGRAASAPGEKLVDGMPEGAAPGSQTAGSGAGGRPGAGAVNGEQVPGPRKAPKKAAQAKATQPKAVPPKKAAGVDGEEPKVAKVVKKAIRKKTES